MTMMIRSVPFNANPVLAPRSFPSDDLLALEGRPRLASTTTIRCSSRNRGSVPKLEPFSKSKMDRVFDRIVNNPPLIQKTENELADYCTTLEGDPCHSCWRAYFELKELEKEAPKEDVERVITSAGGAKSLIKNVHRTLEIYKAKKQLVENYKNESNKSNLNSEELAAAEEKERSRLVPDGLPKTQEELEEEEKAKMPDSAFTRLLRSKGRKPID